MKALAIVGCMLGGVIVGLACGSWVGERRSSGEWFDFTSVFYAFGWAFVGAMVGTVVGAVAFT